MSTELQRCNLALWNDSATYAKNSSSQYSRKYLQKDKTVLDTQDFEERSAKCEGVQDVISKINSIAESNSFLETFVSSKTEAQKLIKQDLTQQNTLVSDNNNSRYQDLSLDVSPTKVQIYVSAPHGLFPSPISKSSKLACTTKARSKFKFLGKFMAKAVMDKRMVSSEDINLFVYYKNKFF